MIRLRLKFNSFPLQGPILKVTIVQADIFHLHPLVNVPCESEWTGIPLKWRVLLWISNSNFISTVLQGIGKMTKITSLRVHLQQFSILYFEQVSIHYDTFVFHPYFKGFLKRQLIQIFCTPFSEIFSLFSDQLVSFQGDMLSYFRTFTVEPALVTFSC